MHDLLLVELVDAEYYHDSEMWFKGHSRSLADRHTDRRTVQEARDCGCRAPLPRDRA